MSERGISPIVEKAGLEEFATLYIVECASGAAWRDKRVQYFAYVAVAKKLSTMRSGETKVSDVRVFKEYADNETTAYMTAMYNAQVWAQTQYVQIIDLTSEAPWNPEKATSRRNTR